MPPEIRNHLAGLLFQLKRNYRRNHDSKNATKAHVAMVSTRAGRPNDGVDMLVEGMNLGKGTKKWLKGLKK